MDEKEKIAIEQLEKCVEKYKIFIDTCSLLHPAADLFWGHLIPILNRYEKKIFLPYKCYLELEKHTNGNNSDLANNAKKAIETIKRLQASGYIDVREGAWEADTAFADPTFKSVFEMFRDRYDMLLITQDKNLAKEIFEKNNSNAVKSKHEVLAKQINQYGYLSSISWEMNNSQGQEKTNSSSTFVGKSNPAFRLCTEVSNISAASINISYIPKENDVVLSKSGEIQLGKSISSGGEGTIYETNTPYVAKIYHEGKLTQRNFDKLKKIIEKQLQCEGICFPVSGLYNKNKEFVGYLMPKAKGKELQRTIFIKPLFQKCFPDWKKKDLVELCITILNKIQYLHDQNIIMGDINAGNILVVSPTEVYFVDTDSYQIEDLPCPVGIQTFTPPELLGKNFKAFLRTMGNEYFAVATLLFMLMLPGKTPYAQKGGEDPITNIKNMDFSYPCGDKSNKKTPDGPWGYCWSHLSYKLKEAFYETFQKDGKYSTERTRLPVSEWIKLFKQYYYELTDPEGNMLKNDAMSGELFPTRLKKNPNVAHITCKLCQSEVEETYSKNGICNKCLRLSAGKCEQCGNDLDFTNFDLYIKNTPVPKLCKTCTEKNYCFCVQCGKKIPRNKFKNNICGVCQKNLVYKTIVCTACGNRFDITYGEKDFFDKKALELPKRCPNCRKNGNKSQASPSKKTVVTNKEKPPSYTKYSSISPTNSKHIFEWLIFVMLCCGYLVGLFFLYKSVGYSDFATWAKWLISIGMIILSLIVLMWPIYFTLSEPVLLQPIFCGITLLETAFCRILFGAQINFLVASITIVLLLLTSWFTYLSFLDDNNFLEYLCSVEIFIALVVLMAVFSFPHFMQWTCGIVFAVMFPIVIWKVAYDNQNAEYGLPAFSSLAFLIANAVMLILFREQYRISFQLIAATCAIHSAYQIWHCFSYYKKSFGIFSVCNCALGTIQFVLPFFPFF